jgi:hypothetical protein
MLAMRFALNRLIYWFHPQKTLIHRLLKTLPACYRKNNYNNQILYEKGQIFIGFSTIDSTYFSY